MRFVLTFAAVLCLALCNPSSSFAQGKGRQGGSGGKCGSQQTTNSSSTTTPTTSTSTQTSITRNQLLLQQGVQQRLLLQQGLQQQLHLRQAIPQQQLALRQSVSPPQSGAQYLESVSQQSDFELQGSLNSDDSRVRQAASKEWKRRFPYE